MAKPTTSTGTVSAARTKSRNGCLTCKKKRLKCDETKPHCLNCTKKGLICGGYATTFKWKTFEETTRGRKNSITAADSGHGVEKPLSAKMRRSMSVPEPVHFEEAFRQASLSIAGKSSDQLQREEELRQSGVTALQQQQATSPSFSSVMRAFTDFQQFNIPSPSALELPSPVSLQHILNDSAIDDESTTPSVTLTGFNNSAIRRAYSTSSSSTSSLPQYRRELLSFSQSLGHTSNYDLTPPPPPFQSTPHALRKAINISNSDFNQLFNTFQIHTSAIMSIKPGSENPWRSLIFPLSLKNPVLFKAIAGMSLSHLTQLNKEAHLWRLSQEYMHSAINELAEGLSSNSFLPEVSLATCLVLAITEGWNSKGKASGILHLKGARSIIKKLKVEDVERDKLLFGFLINTFIYFDVLCRMSNVGLSVGEGMEDEKILTTADRITPLDTSTIDTSGQDHPDDASDSSIESFMNPLISGNFIPSRKVVNDSSLICPLLGIAKSLFLIIGKVATFISKVRALPKLSLSDISTAVKFKTEIEAWKPQQSVIQRSINSSDDLPSCIATAEAYRFSTLLYLEQVVPEISSTSPQDLADKVLMLLASIPTDSNTLILHIFPMLVASCEIEDSSDRRWILERWEVLGGKIWLSNVEQAVDIIKEVWKRKDSLKGKNAFGSDSDMAWDLFQGRIDALVGERGAGNGSKGTSGKSFGAGWTHWSTVMKEWGLEVLFG